MDKNVIEFYPNAQWATLMGSFTADELREIADKIENPELQKVDKDGEKD